MFNQNAVFALAQKVYIVTGIILILKTFLSLVLRHEIKQHCNLTVYMSYDVRLTGALHTVIPHRNRIIPSELSKFMLLSHMSRRHLSLLIPSPHRRLVGPCLIVLYYFIQVTLYRFIDLDPEHDNVPPNLIIPINYRH